MESTECVEETAHSWREKRLDSHFPSIHGHSIRIDRDDLSVRFFC